MQASRHRYLGPISRHDEDAATVLMLLHPDRPALAERAASMAKAAPPVHRRGKATILKRIYKMASPIVPWLGGKRRLADRLLPYFPLHQCYVEPFAGGAAMFFLRPVPAEVEVLNDVNGELINLYRVVKHHLEEFVRQFKFALSSRQVFK